MMNLDGNCFIIFSKRHRLKLKGNTKFIKAVIKKGASTSKDHLQRIKLNNIRNKARKIIKCKMNELNHIKRTKKIHQLKLTKIGIKM